MADERPPIGGDLSKVLSELQRLDAKLDSVRADVSRMKSEGTTSRRVARDARSEVRTGSTAEADRGAIEDTNRKLADQVRVQRQVTTSYGDMAAARRRAAAQTILQESPRDIQSLRNETAALAQVQAGASTEMRRHGALTTEFLSAAARGDATLSEFRYQIGATIAKFAGWTAAGAAVFGVLGAIRELGRGAIDSTSGVAGLGRFIDNLDTEKAAQGFQNVSREVNVSINDVATAQQQFARIYKGQDDSLTAARVSVLATKLDNVDLANSYRFLTGIAQEFQVPASRLPGLFDQISAAQRRAGGKVSELFPAVARSAAAVRNAGGDLSELIALANAAQVASGQTGQSVGTAFYRAPRFVQKNSDVIRQYGLDPTEGFTKLLIDAAKKAQTLSGQDRRKLAEAVGGPQLGDRIFAPLFNRYDLLQKSLGKTSPEAAKGSAAEELKHKLAQPSEQLKAVGFDLERIGATLARIGALDPLGGFLKTLNLSLNVLNDVLGLANRLPGPLRDAGVYALEFYGALRLAKRFNIGDSLVGTRFGGAAQYLRQDDLRRGQRLVVSSYTNELKARQDEFARLGVQGYGVGRARESATLQASQARAQLAYFGSNPPGDPAALERRAQAERRLIAAEETFKRRDAQMAVIMTEQADQAAVITALQQRRNELEAVNTKAQRQALVEEEKGRVVPVPGATPPTAQRPKALGETLAAGTVAGNRAAADQGRLATQVETAARNNVATGAAYGLLRGGYEKASTAAKKVGPKVAEAAAKMKTAEVPILGMLGPIDLAIAGFFGMEFAMDALKKRVSELDKGAGKVPSTAAGAADMLAGARAKIEEAANPPGTRIGPLAISTPGYGLGLLRDKLLGVDPLAQYERDQDEALNIIQAQNRNPITSGKVNAQLGADTLTKQIDAAKKKRNDGALTLAQYDNALATALKDVRQSTVLTKDQRDKLTAAIQDSQTGGPSFLSTLQVPDLEKRLQAYTSIAGTGTFSAGGRHAAVTSSAQVLAELATRLNTPTATFGDIQQLASAEDSFVKAVSDNAQTILKRGLLYARGLGGQDAAYNQAIQATEDGKRQIDQRIKSTEASVAGHQSRVKQLEGLRAAGRATSLTGGAAQGLGGLADYGPDALKAIDAEIKSEKQKGTAAANSLKALRKTRADIARAIQDQVKELRDAQVQKEQETFDLRAQIAAAGTASQAQSTAILLSRAGQKVTAYIKQFGRDDTRTLQAILEQRNLQQQEAQAIVSSIGAGYDISIARTADPVNKAQLGVGKVQAQLAHAKGDQRQQLVAEYYNALAALDQARLQEADAEFDLQKSRTNDPVRQATIQVRQDQYDLQHARGRTGQLQARAKLNTDRFAAIEAKTQDKVSEAEFLRSIGQLTNDAEVAILKNLLRQSGISKSTRHQIQKLMYDLTHGSEDLSSYELTVGSIRLPSTYEIRRAAQQGQSYAHSVHSNVANTNTFNIRVEKGGDAGEVFAAIDSALGTGLRSNLRSAGAV